MRASRPIKVTGDKRWYEEAMRAYRWYLGANDLDLPLATRIGRRLLRRADANRFEPESGRRVDSGAPIGELCHFRPFKARRKRGKHPAHRCRVTLRAGYRDGIGGLMQELFNHTLRLRADPSRVVVRPFHIAWAQNGSGPSRSERIVQEVLAMSPAEASAQLEIVLKDFEARHWQTRRVFMTRYDEIEEMLKPRRRRYRRREAPAARRLFLPRIQLCRRRADEPQRRAALRSVGHAQGIAAYPHVAARGGGGAYLVGVVPRGHHHRQERADPRARAALRHRRRLRARTKRCGSPRGR
jgi:hypothetical protein